MKYFMLAEVQSQVSTQNEEEMKTADDGTYEWNCGGEFSPKVGVDENQSIRFVSTKRPQKQTYSKN